MKERVDEAAAAVRQASALAPGVAVILGSGMSGVLEVDSDRADIPYDRLPHWPRSGVAGHAGMLTLGRIRGVPTAILKGRVHYYEGYDVAELVFPVRVLARLGVRTLIVTNASGSVRAALRPGDLVAIRDHINLMGCNPLRGLPDGVFGPRFVELGEAYDAKLRALARRAARQERVRMGEGVYVALAGPSYETPAEIRMVQRLGGDLVGMSTVPEVIAARQMGMRVLGVSLVTNRAAGLAKRPLSHQEVIEVAKETQPRLGRLLRRAIAEIGRLP